MKKMIGIILTLALLLGMLSMSVFAENPAEPSEQTVVKTIHVYIPPHWSGVYAYTWDPEALGHWPGSRISKSGDWYSFNFDGTNLILSDGTEDNITDNIIIPEKEELWICVSLDNRYTISERPISIPDTPYDHVYHVVGSIPAMGYWDVNSEIGKMSQVSDYKFGKTFKALLPGEYQFKVVRDHSWDTSWGDAGGNYYFELTQASDVTIYYHAVTEQISLRIVPVQQTYTYTVVGNAAWMGNWDVDSTLGDMTEIEPDVFRTRFMNVQPGSYAFLVVQNHRWDKSWGTGESGQDDQFYPLNIDCLSNVTVTFHAADQTITVELEDAESGSNWYPYTVIGSADFMGTWDVYSNRGNMTKVASNTYQITFFDVPSGDYYFRVVRNHSWDESWGLNGSNYPFTVPEGCLYDVTITFQTDDQTITVQYHNNEPPIQMKDAFKVVGSADFMGQWDVVSDLGLMTETEAGTYEITFVNVEPGRYSFLVVNGDTWDYKWGLGDHNDVIPFQITELTNVTIILDRTQAEAAIRIEYSYNRLGDFGGDGLTDNIGGVARLFAHVRGKTLLAEDLLPKADTNQDGKINIADVARMFKAVRTGENLPTIPTTE